MPRPVEPQSDQFSLSPHFQDLDRGRPSSPDHVEPGSAHDHAYHLPPNTGGEYDSGSHRYEPTDHEIRQRELADDDQASGLNWGPPPADPYM